VAWVYSEQLFAGHSRLIWRALSILTNCLCDLGCPSCVGPVEEVGAEGKQYATTLLKGCWKLDLSSKLRRFLPQEEGPKQTKKQVVNLDPFLHGAEVETPYGPCYVVEKIVPIDTDHGHPPLQPGSGAFLPWPNCVRAQLER